MRSPHQLLHSRARVRDRYALMPLEGFPPSVLPQWKNAEARILAAPALGARFAQYLISALSGASANYPTDNKTETFIYMLSGEADVTLDEKTSRLTSGGFAFIPHKNSFRINSKDASEIILLRKAYETAEGITAPKPIFSNESSVSAETWMGNEGTRLQTLIPADDLSYDMAMNIFTFDPGQSLTFVETHVMEHGLYFLQGKGVYFLDDTWMEVEENDFIWMGPYCPQCFYATGPMPAKYLYYKNVNREICL